MNKHTPGPWRVVSGLDWPNGPEERTTVVVALLGEPCHVAVLNSMSDNPEADARLIAAAPDLLAALKVAVDLAERHYPDDKRLAPCYAAIARAEGR